MAAVVKCAWAKPYTIVSWHWRLIVRRDTVYPFDIAGQFGILLGVTQYQVLHYKFEIDESAAIVLDVEAAA